MIPPVRLCTIIAYSIMLLLPAESLASFGGAVDLIPAQTSLPEPWGLLKSILLFTFYLHLLLVNILIGSCMLALAGSFRTKSLPLFSMKEETAFIAKVLALAVNLGVAPYLFMQVLYGSFFYPSTLLMSAWWMAIIGFVMLSYYGLYIVSGENTEGRAFTKPILAILTLMLLATAFILTNNTSLMLRPDKWIAWIHAPGGTVLNTGDPTLIPRYLHILLASAAIGGLAHAWIALWKSKRSDADPRMTQEKIERGLRWFRYATIAQVPVGLWYFMKLPPETRQIFMGGNALATTAFALSLLGTVAALGLAYSKKLHALCAVSAALCFIMVLVRDLVRDASLLPYVQASDSLEQAKGLQRLPLALEHGRISLSAFSRPAQSSRRWSSFGWRAPCPRPYGKAALTIPALPTLWRNKWNIRSGSSPASAKALSSGLFPFFMYLWPNSPSAAACIWPGWKAGQTGTTRRNSCTGWKNTAVFSCC